MRLLALSDTHGNISALTAVLRQAKEMAPDTAVFLGDGIHDLSKAAAIAGFSCAWHTVRGNNDYMHSVPEAAVLDFGAYRFFLCHGHRYSLYGGFDTLIAAAHNNNADAALFGHTHVPCQEYANGLVLINPGSVGRPRRTAGATFALVDCAPDMPLQVQFWEMGHGGELHPWPSVTEH